MNKRRIDVRFENEEILNALEEVKRLVKRNTYADAIRDVVANYPRLLSELEKKDKELEVQKRGRREMETAIKEYFSAQERMSKLIK